MAANEQSYRVAKKWSYALLLSLLKKIEELELKATKR